MSQNIIIMILVKHCTKINLHKFKCCLLCAMWAYTCQDSLWVNCKLIFCRTDDFSAMAISNDLFTVSNITKICHLFKVSKITKINDLPKVSNITKINILFRVNKITKIHDLLNVSNIMIKDLNFSIVNLISQGGRDCSRTICVWLDSV